MLITFSFRVNENGRHYIVNEEIPENEWIQAVMVYNGPGGESRVHINGEVKIMQERLKIIIGEISGHVPVVIGRRYVEEDDHYCSTMVDELMLWNKSLTEQEVEEFLSCVLR